MQDQSFQNLLKHMQANNLVKLILNLHQNLIITWKINPVQYQETGFPRLVEENHAFNFQLWHAEDKARRDDKGFEFVYKAKRAIDSFNQQRNNCMEAIDSWLFNELQPAPPEQAPLHSETPGMMIDRLSILALKSYHMRLQTQRRDETSAHKTQCQHKLHVIEAQLTTLAKCLEIFLTEIQQQNRTFKIYHQFKMYNDPTLNPELYQKIR